ncbi:MAG: glutamyl-tRNA reductase [Bryobacteraceae bacterium]
MTFSITGLNHRTAPVEIRERLAFDSGSIPGALRALKRCPGVQEGLILSTCNRVEIAVASDQLDASAVGEFLACVRSVDHSWIRPYLYRYSDREAIHHLFRVAASLDSMVIGEPQILGQLKSAYALAKEEGAVSGFLEALLTRAFNVAKRVRSETEIGQSAVSVSYSAVELAREIFGSLKDKAVLILGAGKMSESTARNLQRCGASQIFVANRTLDRARAMAALFDARIIPYECLSTELRAIDIVIASTAASEYVLTEKQMREVIEARRNRPMFLIDIAVPRNVEPAVNGIDNVYLYDIDDLQQVVARNLRGREQIAGEAEIIIAEEVERMLLRLKSREIVPTIVSLQEQFESLRVAEITRLRGRFGDLTPQQEEALDQLTRGIVNKIAHAPISELHRHAAHPDGIHFISAIRKLFHLGD